MEPIYCQDTKETCTTYSGYLNSLHWKKFRKKVMKKNRKNLCCSTCGSKEHLNVHHKNYKRVGNEKLEDVVLFCADCHHRSHEKVKEVVRKHKGRNLNSITNRVIRSTLLKKRSHYNFLRMERLDEWRRKHDNGSRFVSKWQYSGPKMIKKYNEGHKPRQRKPVKETGLMFIKTNGKWELVDTKNVYKPTI